ncbi:MAG: YdiU family protein [Pelomonas sp.]|nr:YdiU family protein [Roseateles sp.]
MADDASPFLRFDNSFAREMAGFYAAANPEAAPAPHLVRLNVALAAELGAPGLAERPAGELAALFAGNAPPAGAAPLAQAYAGHQFGGFSPSLGDGRALLLGEVVDVHGRRRDIAFKGSGRTPFSRRGDGRAALGPMLREYLLGEAMHGLGIPTTRALAVVATGETVRRERPLPGAVLTRVAASHLRVGTFEFFAARGETERLRRLADYAIARHDPGLVGIAGAGARYLAWLEAVGERQARLIAQWMGAGFIHGVMNTDNATLSGETIDYGPCAFMEAYDPGTVFSSIDHGGRYAYANQPPIAQWNLARLAEAVLPLLDADPDAALAAATAIVEGFAARYEEHWRAVMRAKLGLDGAADGDAELARDWLGLLEAGGVDYTLAMRALADALEQPTALERLFPGGQGIAGLADWWSRWQARSAAAALDAAGRAVRAARLRGANPLYIARNHRVEAALDAASRDGDLAPFERLLDVLARPFEAQPGCEDLAQAAPAGFTAGFQTFCGT